MIIKGKAFYDDKHGYFKNAEYVFETDIDKLNRFIREYNLDKSDVINVIRDKNEKETYLILYYWSKEENN